MGEKFIRFWVAAFGLLILAVLINPVSVIVTNGQSLVQGEYQNLIPLTSSDSTKGTASPIGSCEPTASQVALYVDVNYQGQCVRLGVGDYAIPDSIGLPNDSISSLNIGDQVAAVLCNDSLFGRCSTFFESDTNLSDDDIGNDQVSSVRVTVKSGALSIVEPLSLSTNNPTIGQAIRAHFLIRNTGYQPILVQDLTAGVRMGTDWNGIWADFPHTGSFVLYPGQEYQYDEVTTFTYPGSYFVEPIVKINYAWNGIVNANRIYYYVETGY